MLIHRRNFLIIGGCGLALAGCMETAAPVISLRVSGTPGMNPGPYGADRPVTVSVLQLSGSSAFDAADVFALQDPAAALGGELIRSDQIVLAPGATAARDITLQTGVTTIGVTAGFREPAGKIVRRKIAAPAEDIGLMISVGSGGLSVTTA